MTDDSQLLQRYTQDQSESAFGELVTRHIDLVYSAARRVAGADSHLAEDIAQMVFIDLARKAWTLPRDVLLAGWLYRHACYTAAKAVRTERRRKTREQTAMEMRALTDNTQPPWEMIAPHLDEGLNKLSASERDAILLRFLKRQDLRAVGAALGISEDAAQKRVSRALEKLRGVLSRSGVALTATALASALAAGAATAAPAGLAVSVTASSLAAAAETGGTLTLLKLMATTKLKAGIISAIVVAGAVTSLVVQQQSQAKMREASRALRQQADQLAQLQAENERLSSLASRPAVNSQAELQRLRDEVAGLRKQTNSLATLREEDSQLKAALNRARTKLREDLHGPKEQQTADSPELNARTDYCMSLGGAMTFYARQQGQFPTNLAQVTGIMSGEYRNRTNFAGFTPNQFEIVFQGPLPARDTYAHPNDIIWIREKQPWRNADGKWVKVYTMVGGVGMVHSEADGNFDAWEKRRIVPPQATNQ